MSKNLLKYWKGNKKHPFHGRGVFTGFGWFPKLTLVNILYLILLLRSISPVDPRGPPAGGEPRKPKCQF